MIRLTIKILRQLDVGVPKLLRLLGYHLELVRNLGELAVCRRQVRRGRAQVMLQLGHPGLKHRLLTSGGLCGITGGGLSCGRSSLRLSAASSTDAVVARSFSISASASPSLDASESRSVVAAAAAVSVVVARPSADWRAASSDDRADGSLATTPAAATRAMTSCISSWVHSAWSLHTSRACLRPEDSRVYCQSSKDK
jgi:hypothetical protein